MVRRSPRELARRARAQASTRTRTAVASRPITWIAIAALAVVLAVSSAFGGLERRRAAATPVSRPGEVVTGHPWDVVVERAVSVDEIDGQYLVEPDASHWLVVVATVTVTADEPMPSVGISGALALPDAEGLRRDARGEVAAPAVFRVRDDSGVTSLNPGVPEQVAFLWEQADDADRPASLDVHVVQPTRRRDSLTGLMTWQWDEPSAATIVPTPVRVT